MAPRRDRTPWWLPAVDNRRANHMPMDFTHRGYLLALGLAYEDDEDNLILSIEGLRGYSHPVDATDELVMQPQVRESASGPYEIFGPVPRATRLDPVVAQWLWSERVKVEADPASVSAGLLTSDAWCTHCGHHFESGMRAGELRRVTRWCASCSNRRTRTNPQLVKCSAHDCDHWFAPVRKGHDFCSPACRLAYLRAA